ncbi:MAG: large conductance mechanosensitive channel protein MscL [Alphaproteobacteria bacterium]|nr:MAG: large conductance mechanosensitive channel protein MscL [Alphaproteobacteria bacterium]TAF14248.1 MAG: large conductance mechanosensitive channel protein MscL [Alphaproteobacteria bacterium]TAF38331.1 MAG: large conductance mechanosensitive channel protein MscL [Alphaproteobacteria bacterium]TAF76791.1 MAG: large conductance mechanosensitive channel protein MscL [Alphaproteobacteria bacterium]
MFNDFKAFIMRGNVLDLAVGIVMGAAFTSIVNSLVADVIMPPIGFIMNGIDFSNLFIVIKASPEGVMDFASLDAAKKAGAITLNIGLFINAIINFLIVSFAVFILVKNVNKLYKKAEEKPAEPAAPPASEVYLKEIRDLLAQTR